MSESLLLKWGTVKGWSDLTDASQRILEKYFANGISMSCAMDHPDADRKEILCDLIDQLRVRFKMTGAARSCQKTPPKTTFEPMGRGHDRPR